jgi:hypothetical protein
MMKLLSWIALSMTGILLMGVFKPLSSYAWTCEWKGKVFNLKTKEEKTYILGDEAVYLELKKLDSEVSTLCWFSKIATMNTPEESSELSGRVVFTNCVQPVNAFFSTKAFVAELKNKNYKQVQPSELYVYPMSKVEISKIEDLPEAIFRISANCE